MITCVYLVILLLIVTKLCDVVSTQHRINHAQMETNPFARQIMYRFGTKKAVWIVFLVALIIISVAGLAALNGDRTIKILFVFAGVAISIIQGAAAHSNWTGKDNSITKHIRIMHSAFQRVLRK